MEGGSSKTGVVMMENPLLLALDDDDHLSQPKTPSALDRIRSALSARPGAN